MQSKYVDIVKNTVNKNRTPLRGFEWSSTISDLNVSDLNEIVIGKEISEEGTRIFCKTDFDVFIERYTLISPLHHHYYQYLHLRDDTFVKFFMDFDVYPRENPLYKSAKEYYHIVIQGLWLPGLEKFVKKLSKNWNVKIPFDATKDVIVECAIGSDKWGFHAIADSFGVELSKLRQMWRDLHTAVTSLAKKWQMSFGPNLVHHGEVVPAIDMSNFTSLRILGSSKMEDPHRVLKFYSEHGEETIPYDKPDILKRTLLTYIAPGQELPVIRYEPYESPTEKNVTIIPNRPVFENRLNSKRLNPMVEPMKSGGVKSLIPYSDNFIRLCQFTVDYYYSKFECQAIPSVSSCKYITDNAMTIVMALDNATVCLRQFVHRQRKHRNAGGFELKLSLKYKTIDVSCWHGKCAGCIQEGLYVRCELPAQLVNPIYTHLQFIKFI